MCLLVVSECIDSVGVCVEDMPSVIRKNNAGFLTDELYPPRRGKFSTPLYNLLGPISPGGKKTFLPWEGKVSDLDIIVLVYFVLNIIVKT
jgi:hypothetical protein